MHTDTHTHTHTHINTPPSTQMSTHTLVLSQQPTPTLTFQVANTLYTGGVASQQHGQRQEGPHAVHHVYCYAAQPAS